MRTRKKADTVTKKKFLIYVLVTVCLVLVLAAGVFLFRYQSQTRPSGVFVLIIDTLPASHVGCYGYERDTTPNIDALAADGVRFENAVSTAPWTMPAIAGILTGSLPYTHQAGWRMNPRTEVRRLSLAVMRSDVPAMAELFRENGYYTTGFFNNPFVSSAYKLDRGFDNYDWQPGSNRHIRRARRVVNDAKQWMLTSADKPVFMVLHFFDPHLCYDPLQEHERKFIKGDSGKPAGPFCAKNLAGVRCGDTLKDPAGREFVKALYDAEVFEVDHQVGEFISFLKYKGFYEDSLIVLTADHGEEFWEHRGFEHGHTLYQELLHVPLIIKFPERDFFQVPEGVFREYVSTADIFPTVSSYMKMDVPEVEGANLYDGWGGLKDRQGPLVAMNLLWGKEDKFAFYSQGIKVIVTMETLEAEAYDLEEDPGESHNIYGDKQMPPDIRKQVDALIRNIDESINKNAPRQGKASARTIKMLKSLGYIRK